MNDNNQFDTFSSHQHELQKSEDSSPSAVRSKANDSRRYLRVDTRERTLSFTFEKTQASSLRQIHQFVLENFRMLKQEELDFLLSGGLNHLVTKKSGVFGVLSNKVKTIKNFILNLGKTNTRLLNEINEKAIEQSIKVQLNQKLEQNNLREKMDEIISLKTQLKVYQGQIIHPLSLSSRNKINKEIEQIMTKLAFYQKNLQKKDNRKKIKEILKEIKDSQGDTPSLRQIKSQFLEENKDYIDIMQSIHIQLNPTAELRIDVEELSQSHTIKVKTNFSDRFAKASEAPNGYYLRAPSDLSIPHFVEIYFKMNQPSLSKTCLIPPQIESPVRRGL